VSSIIRIRRLDLIGSDSRIGRLEMFIHLFPADIQFSFRMNQMTEKIVFYGYLFKMNRNDMIKYGLK